MKGKKSLTLIEIVVGAVILALVFGGLVASFVAVRRYVNRADTRLAASNLGRGVLDSLYSHVHANWDTIGDLTLGAHANALDTTIDGRQYTGSYTSAAVTGAEYRQVTVGIIYPTE
jgi:type II secretory pathway pseudopilin PulG